MSNATQQDIIGGNGWVAEWLPAGGIVYVDQDADGDPILDALDALLCECRDQWHCTALPGGIWLLQHE